MAVPKKRTSHSKGRKRRSSKKLKIRKQKKSIQQAYISLNKKVRIGFEPI
ncbi:50S ribosomal protein L32 [Candidatus Vidania fulgoroideorum]